MKASILATHGYSVFQHTLCRSTLLGGLLLGSASSVQAADWNSTNVQILHGNDYADNFGIDDKEKTVFTLENANGWKYGDSFFFVDVSAPTSSGTRYYGEFSPRFSIGKITGTDLSFPGVKDILIATTLEMGTGVSAQLAGIGFALDLPGFAFADLNIYGRFNDQLDRGTVTLEADDGYQFTIDWLFPFEIGSTKWAFEGFADFAYGQDGGTNSKKDNIIAAPRLLLDVSDFWGSPGTVQAGIEYQIWRNKYGIDGVDEDVAQIMLKWNM